MLHRSRFLSSSFRLRQHRDASLQLLDQYVCLAVALDHRFDLGVALLDLVVLAIDLVAQKSILAFELSNVAIVGRVRPRLFANGRTVSLLDFINDFRRANSRVRPRLFASVRLA